MKNTGAILLIVFLLGSAYWLGMRKTQDLTPEEQAKGNPTPAYVEQNSGEAKEEPGKLVGNDKDEHGCIGSAGYSWCAAKQSCIRSFEEDCTESKTDQALVTEAWAKKYKKEVSEVKISFNNKTKEFAKGMVNWAPFEGEERGGGGIFLAAKKGTVWQIAFDGNGLPTANECVKIKADNFPTEMTTGMCSFDK